MGEICPSRHVFIISAVFLLLFVSGCNELADNGQEVTVRPGTGER